MPLHQDFYDRTILHTPGTFENACGRILAIVSHAQMSFRSIAEIRDNGRWEKSSFHPDAWASDDPKLSLKKIKGR
jgi:hypothetical protein